MPDTHTPYDPQMEASARYRTITRLIERLHRLYLDVIRAELARMKVNDINAVQALLLTNIGSSEVNVKTLMERGYYQGSNANYNLKKLVDGGYMHHQRCEIDRRSVRIKLTEKGREVRDVVAGLFERHSDQLSDIDTLNGTRLVEMIADLRRLERFWSDQIRYIY